VEHYVRQFDKLSHVGCRCAGLHTS